DAIAQITPIATELAKMSSAAFVGAKSFGFWSTGEGEELGRSMSDLTLRSGRDRADHADRHRAREDELRGVRRREVLRLLVDWRRRGARPQHERLDPQIWTRSRRSRRSPPSSRR